MKKNIKRKNRKILITTILTIVILVFSSIPCFASTYWYQPNEDIHGYIPGNPTYDAYWIEVEFILDGEIHYYNTQGATSSSENITVSTTMVTNFGSRSYDRLEYNPSGQEWLVRIADTGNYVNIANTDIKMKLHVIDESKIPNVVSWFYTNFTELRITNGNILTEFIGIFVGGIGEMATGIGSGVNEYAQDLFLNVDSNGAITGLSTFGGVVAIFGGIALACGLTALIFNWIRKIGN